jgi:DNA-binding transcriptional ArsR family regulator
MVEYSLQLDSVFGSLADPTRRDMLRRVGRRELSVGQIAAHYDLTFAAVSKHLKILEKAKLISKRRRGKQQLVRLSPEAFVSATEYLEWYRQMWEERLDSLEQYLGKSK